MYFSIENVLVAALALCIAPGQAFVDLEAREDLTPAQAYEAFVEFGQSHSLAKRQSLANLPTCAVSPLHHP